MEGEDQSGRGGLLANYRDNLHEEAEPTPARAEPRPRLARVEELMEDEYYIQTHEYKYSKNTTIKQYNT